MKAGLDARRFRVHAVAKPHKGKTWGSSRVTIFDGENEVGEYERNYPSFSEQTFEPFELDGKWYALYSRDYTSTRVMRLPDCLDLGGEERAAAGFCPVEFYVPRFKKVIYRNIKTGLEDEVWWFEAAAEGHSGRETTYHGFDLTVGPWLSLSTGFVAGYLRGDDSSWKLEAIDLSRAAEGVIVRSARFGHFQLARGVACPTSSVSIGICLIGS